MERLTEIKTSKGQPSPLGATRVAKRVNFALVSKNATAVTLCLFSSKTHSPIASISLNPKKNRTKDVWHISLQDLREDVLYGYKIEGPKNPSAKDRFNSKHLLLDPYAKRVARKSGWGQSENALKHPLGYVDPPPDFDWEEVCPPNLKESDLIIYEMHVHAFTADPTSQVSSPGTFLGIIEKISHLKSLGVNAIELVPVQAFDECDNPLKGKTGDQNLKNYWGYNPINFFALMEGYTSGKMHPITEFQHLVKALHKEGIEVILDLVFNHTAEGNENGPTLSWRGIDNSIYYMLDENGHDQNFSGCGNTLNCNHPVVSTLILDALRFFVQTLHVDGFRFDLAATLTRSETGEPLEHPPLIEQMITDPILAKTKLIAEPWDIGSYQVGRFPGGERFLEWNDQFRDRVRSFFKGQENEEACFANALLGSKDLYSTPRSLNFVTAHDGFSLKDLVSYNKKHNQSNGEDNRDGHNENLSWNCGIEGPSTDSKVSILREKQMRHFIMALLFSKGVPMLTMGDEYGHTKKGNNNTWSQDNKLNWFDWSKLKENGAFCRFVSLVIALRKKIEFNKEELCSPTIEDHFVSLATAKLYIAFNTSSKERFIILPPLKEGLFYYRIINTSEKPPYEFLEEDKKELVQGNTYLMLPHSAILLTAEETQANSLNTRE